jgi:hypothetical protein
MAVLPVRAVGPVAAGMPIIEAAAVVLVVRPTAAARMCSCSAARRVHDRDRGIGSMSYEHTDSAWQPGWMPEQLDHGGIRYAVQYMYDVADRAWCVELSEAVPAPAAWADIPRAATHLPGQAFLTVVVPDEDPMREPTIHINPDDDRVIPYEVMRWYMGRVDVEVARCCTALAESGRGDM